MQGLLGINADEWSANELRSHLRGMITGLVADMLEKLPDDQITIADGVRDLGNHPALDLGKPICRVGAGAFMSCVRLEMTRVYDCIQQLRASLQPVYCRRAELKSLASCALTSCDKKRYDDDLEVVQDQITQAVDVCEQITTNAGIIQIIAEAFQRSVARETAQRSFAQHRGKKDRR